MAKNSKPGVDKRKLTREEAYQKIVATVKQAYAESEDAHNGREVTQAIAAEWARWKKANEPA